MQIELAQAPDTFVLKDKLGSVKLGPTVQIGDFIISGPGEYEVAGIMAEMTEHLVVCHLADMNIAWIIQVDKKLSLKELESIGTTHVLLANLASTQDTVKAMATALSDLEIPLAVFAGRDEEIAELKKAGVTFRTETAPLKLTGGDLLPDRNEVVVLSTSS